MGIATLTEPSGTMAGAVVKTNDSNLVDNMLLSLDHTNNLSENYTYGSHEAWWRAASEVASPGISWGDTEALYILGPSGDYAFGHVELMTFKAPFAMVLTSLYGVASEIGMTLSGSNKFTIRPSTSTTNRNNASWTTHISGYEVVIDSNATPEVEVVFGTPLVIAAGNFVRVLCIMTGTTSLLKNVDLCVKLRWKALHQT